MERSQSPLLAALVFALALCAASAHADPSDEIADADSQKTSQDLFWEGTLEYRAGNYQRAAELFERVYAEVPESEVVFNIALARAKNGQCGQAKARFAEYAAQVSDVAVRDQATAKFSEVIEACVESDSEDESEASALAQREPSVAETPGSSAVPAAALAAPPEAPETTTSGKHMLGWVLVGAAAGAAGTAVYFETERRAASSSAVDAQSKAEYDEFQADCEQAQRLEVVAASVAVALAGLGVTLLVLDAQSGEASVAIGIGTDRAAGIAAPIRFTVRF